MTKVSSWERSSSHLRGSWARQSARGSWGLGVVRAGTEPTGQLQLWVTCYPGFQSVCPMTQQQTTEKVPTPSSKAQNTPILQPPIPYFLLPGDPHPAPRALPRGLLRMEKQAPAEEPSRTQNHLHTVAAAEAFANAGPPSLPSPEGSQLSPGKTIPCNKQRSAWASHNEVWFKCWHTYKILIKIMCMINNIGIQGTGLL